MSEHELTKREISLIEEMGAMRHLVDLQNSIIMCLTVRCGGAVRIDHKERHYDSQNYTLEKTVRTDDLTADIILTTRLK